MPELPEVETVCRALRPHLIGAEIADVSVLTAALRTPLDECALRNGCRGRRIIGIRRRAKYLLVDLVPPTAKANTPAKSGLLLHLGMTGAFRVCAPTAPREKHARVIWHLADGREWRYLDPRKFGQILLCRFAGPERLPQELGHLGPEPLVDAFSTAYFWEMTRRHTCPIKNLIMHQEVVVGVGNIYANEACFRAGIRPQRPANRLRRRECEALVCEIKAVLDEAILCGGTTIDDFTSVDGDEGKFHIALQVYGRTGEACTTCGDSTRIRRCVLGGRSTFYCATCQT